MQFYVMLKVRLVGNYEGGWNSAVILLEYSTSSRVLSLVICPYPLKSLHISFVRLIYHICYIVVMAIITHASELGSAPYLETLTLVYNPRKAFLHGLSRVI